MSHPYYPLDLVLDGVQPLVLPFDRILAVFFSACALVLAAGWYITGKCLLQPYDTYNLWSDFQLTACNLLQGGTSISHSLNA